MSEHDVIPISRPTFGENEIELIREVLDSGWVTQGPKVRQFEELFAEKSSVTDAVAVTSCTAGLHLALVALGVGPDDEVIVPSFTWISTANVVQLVGAKPVLVDVDPLTYNISPDAVAAALTERTKAVIPVHLFGLCADMDGLSRVLPEHVHVIGDAACGAGASYNGRPAGALGRMGVFSFHPRKAITTGEGGMITTDDAELAGRLRVLRNHGASTSEEDRHRGPRPYSLPEFNVLGLNYRMTDFQGAFGIGQLKRLDEFVAERTALGERYDTVLADLDWIDAPYRPEGCVHGWQAYVARVHPEKAGRSRNDVMEILQDDYGISTRPGTHAVHMQGLYKERFGYRPEDLPNAMACHENTMALPLFNGMTAEQFDRVARALRAL